MTAVYRQRQMLFHWLAMIAPAHESDRRPERAHAFQMRVPIGDPLVKDRPEQLVIAYPVIKNMHKAYDHGLVDTGTSGDFGSELSSTFGRSHDARIWFSAA
jgi:hypothetical protein